jgi:hypothetical protein
MNQTMRKDKNQPVKKRGFSAAFINGIAVLSIGTLLAFYVFFVRENLATTFDDAYMFIRYAKNLLGGYGFAWNRDGIPTYGFTSTLYLFVITLVQGIIPNADPGALLVITSAALSILAIVIMTGTMLSVRASGFFRKYPTTIAAAILVVFTVSPYFLFHAASGMDTSLSLLCNSLLIFAVIRWLERINKTSLFLVIGIAYLSFLARPDNLIYAMGFPILYNLLADDEGRTKRIAHFLIGLAILLALDTAAKFAIFGDPLPLPFYAKSNGHYSGYAGIDGWNPVLYLFDFGNMALPFSILLIMTASKNSLKLVAAFLVPALVTFAYYFSVIQIMGFQARYYFPAMPFFIVSSFVVFDKRLQREGKFIFQKNLLRIGLSAATAIFFLTPTIRAASGKIFADTFIPMPMLASVSTKFSTPAKTPLPHLGWWKSIEAISEIAAHLPAGTNFAFSEYGRVGAYAPQVQIIDPLGLNDPFFAHHGFSAEEFFKRQPDLIWLPHLDYTQINAAILDAEEFQSQYEYYPGAFDYGLALCKNSSLRLVIYEAVKTTWQKIYQNLHMEEYLASPGR